MIRGSVHERAERDGRLCGRRPVGGNRSRSGIPGLGAVGCGLYSAIIRWQDISRAVATWSWFLQYPRGATTCSGSSCGPSRGGRGHHGRLIGDFFRRLASAAAHDRH